MFLLAVDTATNCGGVALCRNAEVVALSLIKRPLRYSEGLLYQVDFVLRQFELSLKQIDCFAVASGPGSFAGLRIGIATVKAFCQALERPGVGISTLEALAYRFRAVSPRVAPLIDARRQQVFAALYEVGDEGVRTLIPPQVDRPAAWLHRIPPQPILYVGDGARMYASSIQAIRPEGRVLKSDNSILIELCGLAQRAYTAGRTVPADALQATYVRPPDAQPGAAR